MTTIENIILFDTNIAIELPELEIGELMNSNIIGKVVARAKNVKKVDVDNLVILKEYTHVAKYIKINDKMCIIISEEDVLGIVQSDLERALEKMRGQNDVTK